MADGCRSATFRGCDRHPMTNAREIVVARSEAEGADAVLAASIFHYGEYTVAQAKALMASRGVAVRQ